MRRCAGADTASFAGERWGRRPLLTRREPGGAGFADLLTLDVVDELLSRRGLRTPFLRVVKDGSPLDPSRFTRSGGAGAEIGDQVADDLVLQLILAGATVVLQGLHRVWPPVIDFASQLAADLGHPVQVNAYVTPASSQGFAAHYDVHDVFVLQVAGSKRWLVHEPVHPLPLRSQPSSDHRAEIEQAAAGPPLIDEVLRPGDALYLPRGYLHSATALGEVSAHLTVGVHPLTRHAIVEALAALAAGEPELRESLPLGIDLADPDALAGELAQTVQLLVKHVENTNAEDVVARLRPAAWSATRPAPIGPLAQAAATESLGAHSVVLLRPQLRHRLRVAGDRVVIELADRTISLPVSTQPALDVLLSGFPVTVADLPGLDGADGQTLVRRLLREAVLIPSA